MAATTDQDSGRLEQLVTRLAPLYRERSLARGELAKLSARLEKLGADIASLEAELRAARQTH